MRHYKQLKSYNCLDYIKHKNVNFQSTILIKISLDTHAIINDQASVYSKKQLINLNCKLQNY